MRFATLRWPRDVHAWLQHLALAFCVYFAIHGVVAGLRPIGSDFTIYYRAGEALLAGRDPLDVDQYIYLPFFACLVAPLSLLPYALALVAWQAASLVALAWVVRRCAQWADPRSHRRWLAWAPLVVCLRLVDSSLSNGQANLLVLAALLAAVDGAVARRESSRGLWLGLATGAKVLPAGLLLPFATRGRWRVVATALSSVFVALLLPALALGWSTNLASLQHWWRTQPLPYLQGGRALLEQREYLPGQSLTATAYRLLASTPATSAADPAVTAEWIALDPDVVRWIVRASSALCAAFLLATLVRSRRQDGDGAREREFALTMCFVLMLGPLVHKAHMVWLLWPFALLCSGPPAGTGRWSTRVRWTLVGLSVALIGLTSPALLGRWLATWVLAHNAVFFGLLCATAALSIDAWTARAAGMPGARVSGTRGAGILRASQPAARP